MASHQVRRQNFLARTGQVHQIRGKTWEVLSPQDAKVGKRPNFGVISEIQRAKFGAFVTYIFGGKIWGSNKNFRGKFWSQVPRSPNMEVPPWNITYALQLAQSQQCWANSDIKCQVC